MAKPKLILKAAPTFKAKVSIPVPGAAAVDVEFTMKGRTRTEFKDFVAGLKDREDVDALMDICTGWDLDDAFTRENIEILTENYLGAARAVIEKYFSEITNARLGN